MHNIPGNDLSKGDHLIEYSPKYEHEESDGLKRFVVLIYKQQNELDVSELAHFDSETFRTFNDSRGDIHVKTVASFQKLSNPIAGNFFYVDWNDTKESDEQTSGNIRSGNFRYPEDCNEKVLNSCIFICKWTETKSGYLQFVVKIKTSISTLLMALSTQGVLKLENIQKTTDTYIVSKDMFKQKY